MSAWKGAEHTEVRASSFHFLKCHLFHPKESARHWAVETRVAPDYERASRGERDLGD